jgi:trans-aconitate methyltransferase
LGIDGAQLDMVRDTLRDWQQIGASEPWYGVLSTAKFLKANLTPAAVKEFYKQGIEETQEVVDRLILKFGDFRPAVALDFGCGLGRLSFAMAAYCDHVIGVDVSPDMLKEAERQSIRLGADNVRFQPHLEADQRVDWINSYIVFQHIVPKLGLTILEGLLDRLNLHGFVSIQLTYFHDNRHLTEVVRDVAAYSIDGEQMKVLAETPRPTGAMAMYDYDLNAVFRLLRLYGLDETRVVQTDHSGCHGLWLLGRKQR